MKKVLIGLFSLLSMTAFAEGYNVYVRGGVNFVGGMPDLKKVYLDESKKLSEKVIEENLEKLKVPGGSWGKRLILKKTKENIANVFDSLDAALTMEKKFIKGYNLSLEGTKNINENLELGLGVTYRINKPVDYKFNTNTFIDKSSGIDKDLLGGHSDFITKNNFVLRSFSYNSIPVYITAKYNLGHFNEFKPYVKADLGYSFNILNDKVALKGANKDIKEFLNKDISNKIFVIPTETKISNGLYIGGAIGTEYKNFIVELAGSYTKAEAKAVGKTHEIKISAPIYNIGINVGYKFNF